MKECNWTTCIGCRPPPGRLLSIWFVLQFSCRVCCFAPPSGIYSVNVHSWSLTFVIWVLYVCTIVHYMLTYVHIACALIVSTHTCTHMYTDTLCVCVSLFSCRMSWWSPCYQDCTLILCLSLETRVSVCSPAALLMPRWATRTPPSSSHQPYVGSSSSTVYTSVCRT